MTTYHPQPIDTSDVQLSAELKALTEQLAENVHEVWSAVRPRSGHTVTEQTLIRLKNVQPNKNYLTKKLYPFFAQYDVVMTRL